MKRTMLACALLLTAAGLFLATGCSGEAPRTQVVYTCPMHPNVIGMEGAKCSSCGMPLDRREVRAANEERGGSGAAPAHDHSSHGH